MAPKLSVTGSESAIDTEGCRLLRERYSSPASPAVSAAATVDRHIADLRYAGMQAGIASWWGVGSKEDRRVPLLLARARRRVRTKEVRDA